MSTACPVEWNGKPIAKVRKGFAAAVKASGVAKSVSARLGLPLEITPHILRHTAATWLMQAGTDLWQAAGFLGMSPETLRDVYGHHHPDFQKEAAEAAGGPRKHETVRETVRAVSKLR